MNFGFQKIDSEFISAEKYANLSAGEKSNIESTKIIAPKLGDNNFGKIQIIYRTPIYKENVNE